MTTEEWKEMRKQVANAAKLFGGSRCLDNVVQNIDAIIKYHTDHANAN